MVKMLIYCVSLILILCACNKNAIQNKEVIQDQQIPVTVAKEEDYKSPSVESITFYLEELYCVKAEKKAIELQKNLLKSEYETENMQEDKYLIQKKELEDLENSLNLQEEEAKQALNDLGWGIDIEKEVTLNFLSSLETDDKEEIMIVYHNIEVQKDLLEQEEKALEEQFSFNKITKEQFISEQTSLERRKDAWEAEKEVAENKLEQLGIDD